MARQYRYGSNVRHTCRFYHTSGECRRTGDGDLSGADEVFQRRIHWFCGVVLFDPELDKAAVVCLGRQIDAGSFEGRPRDDNISGDRSGDRHIAFEKHFAKEFYADSSGIDLLMRFASFVDEFIKNGDFLIFAICNRSKWCYINKTRSGGCSSVG